MGLWSAAWYSNDEFATTQIAVSTLQHKADKAQIKSKNDKLLNSNGRSKVTVQDYNWNRKLDFVVGRTCDHTAPKLAYQYINMQVTNPSSLTLSPSPHLCFSRSRRLSCSDRNPGGEEDLGQLATDRPFLGSVSLLTTSVADPGKASMTCRSWLLRMQLCSFYITLHWSCNCRYDWYIYRYKLYRC